MVIATRPRTEKPARMPGRLPQRMRVLYVSTPKRTGRWLAEALSGDRASQVDLDEAIGVTAAFSRLRDEVYDVVLLSHEPGLLDALDLVEGLRTGGYEEPIIILGHESEQEMMALGYEVGADAYVCVDTGTTRNLIWTAARAIERHEAICESRRLTQEKRQRILQEQLEADQLLQQQRTLIDDLAKEELPSRVPVPLPERLVSHYREMMRAYVIMGSGDMDREIRNLAQLLVDADMTAQQTMRLHLDVLEELVHGLGSRSTRHVMSRGDRLALEMTIFLTEGYRQRLLERIDPPRQRTLPGFEPA